MARRKKETHKDLAVHHFKTQKSWLTWLSNHSEQPEAVWLKFAKKGSGQKSTTYEEAREAAIMYGWIDGLINKYDEEFYLIRFSARRPRSKWSKINRSIAVQLLQDGKMQPRGIAEVEAARSDGRWEMAYDSASTIEVPAELQSWLKQKRNKKAREFFESLNSGNRYAFLYRIQTAKNGVTRNKWIEKTKEMLTNGQVFHPNRK